MLVPTCEPDGDEYQTSGKQIETPTDWVEITGSVKLQKRERIKQNQPFKAYLQWLLVLC